MPVMPPMIEKIAELAQTRGDHVALQGAARSLTYAELESNANRIANALTEAGVGEGGRVAYLDLNNPEFFELNLGCAKIGAAIVPLNFRLTPGEMGQIVADSTARVLVVGQAFAGAVPTIRDAAPELEIVLTVGEEYLTWLDSASGDDPGRASTDEDVVLQLYTSGTTGLPKGVMITNENCSKLYDIASSWGVDEDSRCLVAMPLFHIGGSGWAMCGLANGATDVLVAMPEPAALIDTIEKESITNAFLVPAFLQMMCAVEGSGERDYSSMRSIAYGASPITSAVLTDSLETFGSPLFQVYGLTETTGAITELSADDHDPGGPRAHLMRSAGKPYPWVEVRCIDPSTGESQPSGEVGEVLIRSVQNAKGYWGMPEQTEKSFDADGWLHTGDAGFLDDEGYLFLTDRIKDMIVTGAENVYPIEVEDVLSQHDEVADVAVIGVPHDKWGEAVHAVVVPTSGAGITEDELVEWTRDKIAGFKRPKSVSFAEELPRNPTGKLLKRVLRDPFWSDSERSVN